MKQPVGLVSKALHFGFSSGSHRVAVETQSEANFEFAVQKTDEEEKQKQV